ncbi:MAG: HAMP domain-containing histidine kinase [Bacteroidaceae bacterium]|jgi:signal transduction histidine kinase|nr:HAMP domain-containing histidine kinase [Bacteroidaceae bacterium]
MFSWIRNIITRKSVGHLRKMLEAIRMRNFTLHIATEKMTEEEALLAEEINSTICEFREKLLQQEMQYGYFDTLLNTVEACLIVVDEVGKVVWMNRTAINTLCGFRITNIQMLASINADLPKEMLTMMPGAQKLIHLDIREKKMSMSLSMVKYYRKGQYFRLFSMQNMRSVLQENELDAQKKLISVLTHEIMNSLTPIISLSETLCNSWEAGSADEEDTLMALKAIHRRSDGLLKFVENYRRLSKLSAPVLKPVEIGKIIADLQHLFGDEYFHYDVADPSDTIPMDYHQMEQVLINLLKNAQEAVADKASKASVTIHAFANRPERIYIIEVKDNGCGILPDVQEHIFIPFFTTKNNGSGIGLSLCRQIVNNHGGTISVKSSTDLGSTFTVELPLINS